MRTRRTFLKTVAGAGAIGLVDRHATAQTSQPAAPSSTAPTSGQDDRQYWVSILEKIARPVLVDLSKGELRKKMPVETAGDADKLRKYTHLEATARTLVGLAPWLELRGLAGPEARLQQEFLDLAVRGLDAATDPQSPDFMNFKGEQPLVDAAFLAQAILRAPNMLWKSLDGRLKQHIVDALEATRTEKPINNNHILFAALVETALLEMGESTLESRLESYLRQMLGWYVGDGVYGDGEFFRFDYYNSFVIHPALVDILSVLRKRDPRMDAAYKLVLLRSRRYAEIQERLIAPDGTFPSVGRSTCYRFGAFQTLAQMALMDELPEDVKPGQVRCALTAVIRRMIEAPGTFDDDGWLRVGFCGHQVTLGEHYISTGSLYLCTAALLPLGLLPREDFWSAPPARWTAQRLWSGESLPADHALSDDEKPVEIPRLKRR
jgi:hypothetical protein